MLENPTLPREIPTSLPRNDMEGVGAFAEGRYRFKTTTLRRGHAPALRRGRYLVPLNHGIAAPVCALVRNDVLFGYLKGGAENPLLLVYSITYS